MTSPSPALAPDPTLRWSEGALRAAMAAIANARRARRGEAARPDAITILPDRTISEIRDEVGAVLAALADERDQELARLRQWVSDLQSGMFVNCVYCGHRYGPGETTPVSMADALKAHVEQCHEHPMAKLRAATLELLEASERAYSFDPNADYDDMDVAHPGIGITFGMIRRLRDAVGPDDPGKSQKSRPPNLPFPRELTPALAQVLGLMIFETAPIAHAFQAAGRDIRRKAEHEQAFVLHWLITLALEHGEQWPPVAGETIRALIDQPDVEAGLS